MHVFLQGKVSLVSQSGVHQLHIFIFVLAAFHVIYSVVIIALAKAKVCPFLLLFSSFFLMGKGINMTFNCYHVLEHENKWGYASPFPWNLDCKNDGAKKGCEWLEQMKRWKSWELETTSLEYQFTNGNWH